MKDSKTYRIRTKLGSETDNVINVKLDQTFDTFEILSLKLDQKNAYKLYESDYGVIVGRVIANGGFGVPNVKVSVFIESEEDENFEKRLLYPYKSTTATNFDGVRYNLLPDYVDDACHQNVGTFPNKRLVLDNNDIIDIFDKYYVYTTVTNNAGDYMIFGVPTGSQKIHVDLDLSDIGMLSQRPRDLMYKGYKETDFESPNKFKKSTNLNSLAQIYSQDRGVYVYPFWGDTTENEDNIAITRCDIELSYKFEPTCVFMGSIVTDTSSNSISKNCAGSTGSGKMSELVSGEGTIEMIRKTIDNKVESFQIRGNRLIDGDGVWCYQIPMNLDFIMTDEYGNIVPSDNPEKGIPTRTRVRFRISLDKVPNDNTARNRCQYLVPNNPRLDEERYPDFTKTKEVDYEFGSKTKDENYRDLFWNKVYTVKNYIPRLQKNTWVKNRKHTGIKLINHFGDNNPMPYNNMNIKLTFQYRLICVIAKVFINLIRFLNQILTLLSYPFCWIAELFRKPCKLLKKVPWPLRWITKVLEVPICGLYDLSMKMVFPCIEISSEFCGDNVTHNYSFYPGCGKILFSNVTFKGECITRKTKEKHEEKQDKEQIPQEEKTEVSFSTGELYNCVESALAEDNDVVSFNFHNDWINGVLYAPLWFRKITPKKRLLFGLIKRKAKDQWCSSETLQNKKLKVFTPCAITRDKSKNYKSFDGSDKTAYHMDGNITCGKNKEKQNCLNRRAFIGLHNGIIVKRKTILDEDVYYYQAAEFDHDTRSGNRAIEGTPVKEKGQNGSVKLLFATDIVLLGSLNDCDLQGVPQFFKSLESSTYKIPPTLLFTDNVMVTVIDEEGIPTLVGSDDETSYITTQESKTEMTGADWGNMNDDICPAGKNEERSQDSGLFYSIGCNSQRTLPKSCINLSRICEFGVSLDESKHILTKDPTENGSDDEFYDYLVPDGFISKDELYNIDERSAFASLNNNGLHTKLSDKTGLMEYDFDYLLVENFDNSLRGAMENRQKKCSNTYRYNYFLEDFSNGYYDFRMGKKPYFYDDEDYSSSMEKNRQPSGRTLPRYENSFYFYFGLKHGKTALDKFNSQFFSNCYDEDEEFDNVGVIAVGNDWCSDLVPKDRNGYVAFDFSMMDLPCEVVIKSLTDSSFSDIVFETSEEKIYFANWSRERLDMMQAESLEQLRQALIGLEADGYVFKQFMDLDNHPISMFPNGTYEMTVTDKNGEIFTTTFVLKSEFLSSKVIGTNFNYPDNVLLKRFNGDRLKIQNDKTEILPNPISILSTRDIGGTIAVSYPSVYNKVTGEEEEIPYFSIEITGIKDNNGISTYNALFTRKNSIQSALPVLAYNENKTNQETGVVLFGVPKPDECYTIKVSQLCIVDGVFTPSGNSVTYTVCIKEKQPFKLYINEVDYDLISDWMCGFKNTSQDSASVSREGDPSDNWIHMSDRSRYRWYNYIPYQKIDKEFALVTDQIHNMFKDAEPNGIDGVGSESDFLGNFVGSKYNVLYQKHVSNTALYPHVLYNIVENQEIESDITKRSKFWQINTVKLKEELDSLLYRSTLVRYVSSVHVPISQDGVIANNVIDDITYNALYDEEMYSYETNVAITSATYSSLPSSEKTKCTYIGVFNGLNTYKYKTSRLITQEEYNNLSGYISMFCVNKNDCSVLVRSAYDELQSKEDYYYLEVTEEEYNSMSSTCKENYALKTSYCTLISTAKKSDYYDLIIDAETFENLNEEQQSYFTKEEYDDPNYEETPLETLLSNLRDLSVEVEELQEEVINNVKQTFQLTCEEETKDIIYRAVSDDKPITYHEVHKHEILEEENEYQTVECEYKYSNSYNIDGITIPTITTKDSKYFGDEDNTNELNMLKFVGDMYNESGNYSYNGVEKHDKLMISVDNRGTCSGNERRKEAYFVAVNNARYPIDKSKEGNTIPERYRSGGNLGYFFGYHIVDKVFTLNKLAWSITKNIPYFMRLLPDGIGSPVNVEIGGNRRVFDNKLVNMNGLFTGSIRNGNARKYDTYDVDGDKKRAYLQEQTIGNVFDAEIYTYRESGDTDETIEDRMPTMRYITGGDLLDGISYEGQISLIKNYDKYAIGEEPNKPVQDSDMWAHTENKEYCTITKFDEYYTFKDDNDCSLTGNIDSKLKIVLSEDSVNDCQNRKDNTKFGLSIENCSDEDGLLYYVFEAKDNDTIFYPINKAELDDEEIFRMNVLCNGSYEIDHENSIFEKDINKLQYLYTVYTKPSLRPYFGGFPFNENGIMLEGKLGKYVTSKSVKSEYEDSKTEKTFKTDGWSNTGEFTLADKNKYPCLYAVAITGDNTRTISPVYDYRYVCVTLIFGSVFTKNEIIDEGGAISGYDYIENGKMTFDISNMYDCNNPNDYNKILYYFYNYEYKVSFECKLNEANIVQGSYTHTSYVDDPFGYVLFDLSDDGYKELKKIYKGSNGKVGKEIKKNTKIELVDITGLKHIPNWTGAKPYKRDSDCCLAYDNKCWANIMWVTNGGIWKDTHEEGTYLIDAYTEIDGDSYENGYYGSSADFSKLMEEGTTYKPNDVGILIKETGELSSLCQSEEGEGGFLGWSTTPDGLNIINGDSEITIDCDDKNGNGAQIYYAVWADDFVGVQWLDCDDNELKKECNVMKGVVIEFDEMPTSINPDVRFTGWTANGEDVDWSNGYEITGDTIFKAKCATACKPSLTLYECMDIGRNQITLIHLTLSVVPYGESTPKRYSFHWAPTRFGTFPSLSNVATWECPMVFSEGDTITFNIDSIETNNGCMLYTDNGACNAYAPGFSECNWAIDFCEQGVLEGNGTIITIGEGCRYSQVKMVHKRPTDDDCSCETPVRVIWRKDCPGDIHLDTFVCYGEYLTLPAANPKKNGYTFDGWNDGYDGDILLNPVTSETPTQMIDGVPTIEICPDWKADGGDDDEEYTVEFLAEGNNLSSYTKQVNSGDTLSLSDIPEDSDILIPSGKIWPNNEWTHKTKVNGVFVTGSKYSRSEIPTIEILGDTQFVAEFEDETPQTIYNVTFKVGECQIGEIQEVTEGGYAVCPTSEDVEESECFTEGFDVFDGEWRLEGTNQTYDETYINNRYNILTDTVFVAVLTRLGECEYDFYWSIPEELDNKDINGNPVTTDSLAHGVIPSGSVPTPPSDTPPTLNGFNYGGWLIRGGDGTPFDNNNIPAIMSNTIFDGCWIDTGKRKYRIPWRVENYSSKTLKAGHFTLKVNCPGGVVVDSGTDIAFGGDIQPYSGSGEPNERHGSDLVADTMPSDWISLFANTAVVTCQVGNNTVDVTWTRDSGLLVTNTYFRTGSNQTLVVKLYDTAPSYPVTFNAVDLDGNLIKMVKTENVAIATALNDSIIPSTAYICSYASPSGVGTAYNFIEWDDDPHGDVVWSALTYNAKLERKQYNVTFMWDSDNPSNIIVKGVYHGDYAEEPDPSLAPVKEGYTFSGWNPVPSETRITSNNVVFIGVWTPNAPDTVNVTFIAEEQNSSPVVSWTIDILTNVQIGHVLTQNEVPNEQAILAATGNANAYTFGSWEGGQSPAGVEITASTTSFKAYVNKKTFTVSFKVKDDDSGSVIGNEISNMTVPYGYILSSSDLPSNSEILNATGNPDAYDLSDLYWKVGDTYTDFDDGATVEIVTNRTVYAMIIKKSFTVKYVHNNGTGSETNVTPLPNYGDVIEIIAAPQYNNHTFDGWESNLDSLLYQPGTSYTVVNNVVFTGHWTDVTPGPYTVNFYGDNGTLIDTQTIQYGQYATPPSVTTNEGRKFKDAWIRRSNSETVNNSDFATYNINTNMDFDAVIVNEYKVRFQTPSYVSIIGSQWIEENDSVKNNGLPTYQQVIEKANEEGLAYMGNANGECNGEGAWRINSPALDSQTYTNSQITSYPITSETTFYARFSCVVTFDYGLHSSQSSTVFSVEKRTYLTSSQIPTPQQQYVDANYEFVGWNGNTSERIMDNITFIAQWQEKPSATVTWQVNYETVDGTMSSVICRTNEFDNLPYTLQSSDIPNNDTLKAATGEYAAFSGGNNRPTWSPNDPENSVINGDTTFIATFMRNTYNVTFKLCDNSTLPYDGNPVKHGRTINENIVPNPETEGCTLKAENPWNPVLSTPITSNITFNANCDCPEQMVHYQIKYKVTNKTTQHSINSIVITLWVSTGGSGAYCRCTINAGGGITPNGGWHNGDDGFDAQEFPTGWVYAMASSADIKFDQVTDTVHVDTQGTGGQYKLVTDRMCVPNDIGTDNRIEISVVEL